MQSVSIRDMCKVNSNLENDTFVGLKCENGEFSINFPMGFKVSDDDKELRKELLMLLDVIEMTTQKKESQVLQQAKKYDCTMFPIQAYLSVIADFFERGYYKEREVQYTVGKRGKIDWNRTIKTQRPYVQNNEVFYLNFAVKKNEVNENELITLIHEYCVYESMTKVGWLFTKRSPQPARIKFNPKLFKSVLKQKIVSTYNDKNRRLFRDMLAIVQYEGDNEATVDFKYGTFRFEYVWEMLIDKEFGISDKETYFPKTKWRIDGVTYENACLEPDTIMILDENVFVLDAKYYKYGITENPSHLPESTSINKQITYGEYIAENEKFKKKHGEKFKVYNAFLMPYASETGKEFKNIGIAYSDWKTNLKSYEKIQGVLIDIKYLMKQRYFREENEMRRLAEIIEMNFY